MRQRYVIANWKMNLPPAGIDAFAAGIAGGEAVAGTKLVVAPPFPFLERTRAAFRGGRVALGAQNCSDHPSGAYTGEVAASMLRDCGADYVILGHSERRTLFHEPDAFVARKLVAAASAGLVPVLCIGEDLKVREAGNTGPYVSDQVKAAWSDELASASELVVAYEPIWAIGTGRTATSEMVAETVAGIREAIARFWSEEQAARVPVLYGGSVTPDNAADLGMRGGIDGFLVGGASLDAGKFLAIEQGMQLQAAS